jgi:putative tricarboxylic transport membrane protein
MVIWGLVPGPRLFVQETEFVWGLIGSFYISNVAAVLINLAFIPLFIWMLRMPFTILAPMIFVLSIAGGFAATRDMFDIWLIVIFGLGAFVLRRFDYPLAPAVLAIVLGPIAEPTLRQSLLLSSGDPSIFFTRPVAGPITVVALILIFLPALKLLRRRRGKKVPRPATHTRRADTCVWWGSYGGRAVSPPRDRPPPPPRCASRRGSCPA